MSREMKDSGVEWIGTIPSNWETPKLSYVVDCLDGKRVPISSELRKSGPYPYWGAGNITDYVDDYIFNEELVLLGEDGAPFFDKKRNVAFYVKEKIWVNNHIHVLRARNTVKPMFLTHFLNIVDYGSYINGSILNKLTQSNMKKIYIVLPSLVEQAKIEELLNIKVLHINSLIDKTKATIDEYKRLKQSIITEAVTKGLDKNVKMKDSGVEWIGEMPQNWKLIPFKYVMNERTERNNPIVSTERLSLSIDKGVTLYSEKTTNLDRFKDDFSQYKLAHEGDLVFNSMNMIVGAVGVSSYFGCVSPVYYTFYNNEINHVTSKFCEYIFRSKTMQSVLFSLGKGIMAIDRGEGKYNTVRLKVSRDDLRSLELPIPELLERIKIVEFLNNKTSEIDKFISMKELLIRQLEVYKKSLIYEYVTGKKEVE